MELKLNTGILADALNVYMEAHGRGAIASLFAVSGVHNLGRMARGETEPTIDSWIQLHLSVPKWIPPPTTVSGGRLMLVGENEGTSTFAASPRNQIEGEGRLQHLYARHRSPAVVRVFTKTLERLDRATLVKDPRTDFQPAIK